MDLMERLIYHQEQYEELERLNNAFLAEKEFSETMLQLFLLERERCILKMQQQPLLMIEKIQLKELAEYDEAEIDKEMLPLVVRYKLVVNLNRQVVKQDQAVTMKLRNLERSNKSAASPKRRVETYIQTLERTVSDQTGSRYDRLR